MLCATLHHPRRTGQTLLLPPLGGTSYWSIGSLGATGMAVMDGSGNPEADGMFGALTHHAPKAACTIAMMGETPQKVLSSRGADWLLGQFDADRKPQTFQNLLARIEGQDDVAGALIDAISEDTALGATDFVLCNTGASYVYSHTGLFMTSEMTHRDTGAHASVHLSSVPFGNHLWERLPNGCLVVFENGCEARRHDIARKASDEARISRNAAILAQVDELARRAAARKEQTSQGYWSG